MNQTDLRRTVRLVRHDEGVDDSGFEAQVDRLTTELCMEMRSAGRDKQVPEAGFEALMSLTADLQHRWSDAHSVPRVVVGKLWFVFTTMLAEADHASQPEPILDAAWAYAESLRRVFGPEF